MKVKLYFIAIFLFVGICAIQAQEWGYVNTLQNEWLRKIWTQGLDTVYIVGENGLIARSTDQGETWTKQYFPTRTSLNDIIFIDYFTGFAVGEQATILKTTDAGETWKQVPIDFNLTINAIAATGLDNIWAAGDSSLILHSTDAGETWKQENILPENNRQLSDIAFRESLGYFTGNYATVYKTENAGETWNKQIVIEHPDIYTLSRTHSINIMKNKTYFMIDDSLYLTENQIDWVSISQNSQAHPFFLNDSIGFISIAVLFMGSSYGNLVIMETTDCGKTWKTIVEQRLSSMQDIGAEPSKIKMINDTLGYAIFSQVLLKIPALKNSHDNIQEINNKANIIISQNTRDELALKSESNMIKSIEIFDVSGKSLQKKSSIENQFQETIVISGIPNGIYIVKVILSDNTICTKKWIKE